jgi:hypothetical protein
VLAGVIMQDLVRGLPVPGAQLLKVLADCVLRNPLLSKSLPGVLHVLVKVLLGLVNFFLGLAYSLLLLAE